MKMKEEIFRKKSLDKIKAPESLDDYIKVTNPGVWILLISVILLLAGAAVWGIFGHIDSTVRTDIYVKSGKVVCCVKNDDIDSVKTGMSVKFHDFETVTAKVVKKQDNGFACSLSSEDILPDGVYSGEIITESVSPLSFVFN